MEIRAAGALVAGTGLVTACNGGSQSVVAQPSNITLTQALVDTVNAMAAARAQALLIRKNGVAIPETVALTGGGPQKDQPIYRYKTVSVGPIGVNACTITAHFNIAASGTSTVGLEPV